MKIENIHLQEEFYHKIKHKYPDLTFEQVRSVCNAPFVYTRKQMESGNLPAVRIKYLGTFYVKPFRAKAVLEKLKKAFQELKLDSKVYFEKKHIIEKFLENEENK